MPSDRLHTLSWPLEMDFLFRKLRLRFARPEEAYAAAACVLQAHGAEDAKVVCWDIRSTVFDRGNDGELYHRFVKEQRQLALAWRGQLLTLQMDTNWTHALERAHHGALSSALTGAQQRHTHFISRAPRDVVVSLPDREAWLRRGREVVREWLEIRDRTDLNLAYACPPPPADWDAMLVADFQRFLSPESVWDAASDLAADLNAVGLPCRLRKWTDEQATQDPLTVHRTFAPEFVFDHCSLIAPRFDFGTQCFCAASHPQQPTGRSCETLTTLPRTTPSPEAARGQTLAFARRAWLDASVAQSLAPTVRLRL